MEKARLHLVNEEVDRKVAEKIKQSRAYPEPVRSLMSEHSMDSSDITSPDSKTVNLGKYTHTHTHTHTHARTHTHTHTHTHTQR